MVRRGNGRALLSGGIGSGKSTVGQLLAGLGALVIDADVVGHRVLESDGEAYSAVAARWPAALDGDQIDRSALAGIVFDDTAQLRELEAVTHPAIRRRIEARVAASDDRVIIVEVPLAADLMGPGWPRIVVVASRERRLARLQARGMDPVDAARRMASQPTDEQWREIADYVVDNSADRAALEGQMDALFAWLTT